VCYSPGPITPLEGNRTIKYCDNYKRLEIKINENGKFDSVIKNRIYLGRYAISKTKCRHMVLKYDVENKREVSSYWKYIFAEDR
jgi:hypothetical protein